MANDFPEFPKVYGPYKRHTEGSDRNKLIIGEWYRPEFELLAELPWHWTEKIDGTNIRVHWDGHRVTLGGRTANAQLHADLVAWLNENLPEELFEQTFGEETVTLFGEGYGAGIQKGGGNYSPTKMFSLFDVMVGRYWLLPESVEDVAAKLGLTTAPLVMTAPVRNAIQHVGAGMQSTWGDFEAEGLVGRPPSGLLDRAGRRILMKVKTADFKGFHA